MSAGQPENFTDGAKPPTPTIVVTEEGADQSHAIQADNSLPPNNELASATRVSPHEQAETQSSVEIDFSPPSLGGLLPHPGWLDYLKTYVRKSLHSHLNDGVTETQVEPLVTQLENAIQANHEACIAVQQKIAQLEADLKQATQQNTSKTEILNQDATHRFQIARLQRDLYTANHQIFEDLLRSFKPKSVAFEAIRQIKSQSRGAHRTIQTLVVGTASTERTQKETLTQLAHSIYQQAEPYDQLSLLKEAPGRETLTPTCSFDVKISDNERGRHSLRCGIATDPTVLRFHQHDLPTLILIAYDQSKLGYNSDFQPWLKAINDQYDQRDAWLTAAGYTTQEEDRPKIVFLDVTAASAKTPSTEQRLDTPMDRYYRVLPIDLASSDEAQATRAAALVAIVEEELSLGTLVKLPKVTVELEHFVQEFKTLQQSFQILEQALNELAQAREVYREGESRKEFEASLTELQPKLSSESDSAASSLEQAHIKAKIAEAHMKIAKHDLDAVGWDLNLYELQQKTQIPLHAKLHTLSATFSTVIEQACEKHPLLKEEIKGSENIQAFRKALAAFEKEHPKFSEEQITQVGQNVDKDQESLTTAVTTYDQAEQDYQTANKTLKELLNVTQDHITLALQSWGSQSTALGSALHEQQDVIKGLQKTESLHLTALQTLQAQLAGLSPELESESEPDSEAESEVKSEFDSNASADSSEETDEESQDTVTTETEDDSDEDDESDSEPPPSPFVDSSEDIPAHIHQTQQVLASIQEAYHKARSAVMTQIYPALVELQREIDALRTDPNTAFLLSLPSHRSTHEEVESTQAQVKPLILQAQALIQQTLSRWEHESNQFAHTIDLEEQMIQKAEDTVLEKTQEKEQLIQRQEALQKSLTEAEAQAEDTINLFSQVELAIQLAQTKMAIATQEVAIAKALVRGQQAQLTIVKTLGITQEFEGPLSQLNHEIEAALKNPSTGDFLRSEAKSGGQFEELQKKVENTRACALRHLSALPSNPADCKEELEVKIRQLSEARARVATLEAQVETLEEELVEAPKNTVTIPVKQKLNEDAGLSTNDRLSLNDSALMHDNEAHREPGHGFDPNDSLLTSLQTTPRQSPVSNAVVTRTQDGPHEDWVTLTQSKSQPTISSAKSTGAKDLLAHYGPAVPLSKQERISSPISLESHGYNDGRVDTPSQHSSESASSVSTQKRETQPVTPVSLLSTAAFTQPLQPITSPAISGVRQDALLPQGLRPSASLLSKTDSQPDRVVSSDVDAAPKIRLPDSLAKDTSQEPPGSGAASKTLSTMETHTSSGLLHRADSDGATYMQVVHSPLHTQDGTYMQVAGMQDTTSGISRRPDDTYMQVHRQPLSMHPAWFTLGSGSDSHRPQAQRTTTDPDKYPIPHDSQQWTVNEEDIEQETRSLAASFEEAFNFCYQVSHSAHVLAVKDPTGHIQSSLQTLGIVIDPNVRHKYLEAFNFIVQNPEYAIGWLADQYDQSNDTQRTELTTIWKRIIVSGLQSQQQQDQADRGRPFLGPMIYGVLNIFKPSNNPLATEFFELSTLKQAVCETATRFNEAREAYGACHSMLNWLNQHPGQVMPENTQANYLANLTCVLQTPEFVAAITEDTYQRAAEPSRADSAQAEARALMQRWADKKKGIARNVEEQVELADGNRINAQPLREQATVDAMAEAIQGSAMFTARTRSTTHMCIADMVCVGASLSHDDYETIQKMIVGESQRKQGTLLESESDPSLFKHLELHPDSVSFQRQVLQALDEGKRAVRTSYLQSLRDQLSNIRTSAQAKAFLAQHKATIEDTIQELLAETRDRKEQDANTQLVLNSLTTVRLSRLEQFKNFWTGKLSRVNQLIMQLKHAIPAGIRNPLGETFGSSRSSPATQTPSSSTRSSTSEEVTRPGNTQHFRTFQSRTHSIENDDAHRGLPS